MTRSRHSRRQRSIKRRTTVLFVAYLFALCAVYAGFTIALLRREATSAKEQLVQTARMLAVETEAHIAAGRDRLATVAALPGLVHGIGSIKEARAGGPIPPWTTLHYIFLKSPVFTGGVFLLDDTGTVLWTEPPGLEWIGQKLVDLPPIASVFTTKAPVVSSQQEPGGLLESPHIIVANPIIGAAGVVGVLGGVIDVADAAFAGKLSGAPIDHDRFAAVVDGGGKIMAGVGSRELLETALRSTPGDGRPLAASVQVANTPWHIIAGQGRAAAMADVVYLQRLLLAAGLLLAIGVIASGGSFVAGLMQALRSLTGQAAIMAEGDLSQPVTAASDYEEVITLAGTFERMRAELERSHLALTRRVRERDELIQLKEEFLANVSHELRTPLNVIIGYTDMLLDDSRQDEAKEFLGRIRSQSEHLYQLLQDVMTLSALNAGKIAVDLQTVSIPEMLSRLTPTVEACRQGKAIEVKCDVPGDLPPLVTDQSRLEQVLANLINNAFKFTPEGKVEIRARYDRLQQRLVFEVSDTGIGIPEEELDHVFDEFRQIDGSMHRPHEGMGLGLALVRKLTTLLEGDLHVDSHVHEGTTVTVSLPLHLTHGAETGPVPLSS